MSRWDEPKRPPYDWCVDCGKPFLLSELAEDTDADDLICSQCGDTRQEEMIDAMIARDEMRKEGR